jgi:chromatin remodeling complex protein RSC6
MDDEVKVLLDSILDKSDFRTSSTNAIIQELEGMSKRNLECIKVDIVDYILKYLESNHLVDRLGGGDNDGRAESEDRNHIFIEHKVKKSKSVFNREYKLSAPLQELTGQSFCSRPELVKKIWEYVRHHNLQDPKDRRFILCDEKLGKIFKKKRVNCFGMNKDLSNHLYLQEDILKSSESKSVIPPRKQDRLPKMVSLPKELLALGCFEEKMTYVDIQEAFLSYLRQFRSDVDPDLIESPPKSHPLLILFSGDLSVMSVFDLMINLRKTLDSRLCNIYQNCARNF